MYGWSHLVRFLRIILEFLLLRAFVFLDVYNLKESRWRGAFKFLQYLKFVEMWIPMHIISNIFKSLISYES